MNWLNFLSDIKFPARTIFWLSCHFLFTRDNNLIAWLADINVDWVGIMNCFFNWQSGASSGSGGIGRGVWTASRRSSERSYRGATTARNGPSGPGPARGHLGVKEYRKPPPSKLIKKDSLYYRVNNVKCISWRVSAVELLMYIICTSRDFINKQWYMA